MTVGRMLTLYGRTCNSKRGFSEADDPLDPNPQAVCMQSKQSARCQIR